MPLGVQAGKSRAALALAVSLWLATGGVASANVYIDVTNNDTVTAENGATGSGSVNPGIGTTDVKTLTASGNWDFQSLYGGRGSIDGTISGYTVIVAPGATINFVQGGQNMGTGDATGNKVIIGRGATINFGVNGGGVYNGNANATGNTVELQGATVNFPVYGGRGGGSGDWVSGNTLVLSGENTVAGNVRNFETIKLSAALAWDAGATVLNATESGRDHFTNEGSSGISKMTLDISAAANLKNATPGTMTLLSAPNNTQNVFDGMPLKYFGGGTATLNGTNASQTVYTATASDAKNGVTLGYNATHTVKLEDVGTKTKNAVTYNVAASVTTVTLGEMTWGTGRTLTAGGYDFTNVTNANIDTANLKFSNPEAASGNMTLLSGATGLTAGANIDHTQSFTKDANGATLSATLSGNVIRTTAEEIGYTATGTTLNSVNLTGWNGTASAVPTGWTANLGENSVTAAGFTAPPLGPGSTADILTTETANFFADSQITGAMKYQADAESTDAAKGVTLTGAESKGVKASDDGKNLVYARSNYNVSKIALGEMNWNDGREITTGYDFASVGTIDASGLSLAFTDEQKAALSSTSNMTLLTGAANLAADKTVTDATRTQTISLDASNGAALSGTLTGTVSTTAGAVNYQAASMTLDNIDLAGWDGATSAAVPAGWTANLGENSVTAAGFTAPTLDSGSAMDILTTETENFFADSQITGEHQYKAHDFAEDRATNGIAFSGTQSKGVKASEDGKNLVYAVGTFDVETISLGEMNWDEGRTAAAGYNYTNANIDLSKFAFENPETISAGTTTLLQANNTLADIAATEKNLSYTYLPVAGVTMDGKITGSYAATGGNLSYTATENKANKLTFGDVEWKDSGALLDHATTLSHVSFNGADVDTANINFTNIQSLEGGKKMTLVSSFGDAVGTITGTKYKVGSTLEGEGKASLVGNDLIFTAETGTNNENLTPQGQTHNTVMGAEVGMAALSAGNDFIGAATEGLALASNVGADGISSFAQMGGGSMRQETGSHVDTHTWNAILALGHQNKKERGTTEYGAFFEYGSGNYTTHNGDERGDGSAHYTGGGLLAKWTAKHGFYVEGSLRAGTVHDDARNVLRDANGVPYSYETNANYFGGHVGVGKEIPLANGNTVDVYGKYFVNRRNSVNFDAGGHYDLDAVTSQVLRVGARYTVKGKKWNFYAGAAYEHEFDGKANGTADGLAIRGADTSGGSFRGEIGATVTPGENSPWKLDLNVTGFAGKKQGMTGGVSVAFMF